MIGLLGARLGHSFSPAIHARLGNPDYRLFEVAAEDLAAFLARPDLRALNVTLPYKEAVLPYCHRLSAAAEAIGAVNTMVRDRQGRWIGDNTDAAGAALMLAEGGLDPAGRKVLILGGGATAKTLHYVLDKAGARSIVHIERRGPVRYEDLPAHGDAELLVNTTPVGMYPDCPKRLIHLDDLPQLCGVADVLYNPLRTQLLLDAEARGLAAISGLSMLIGQAIAADARFFGHPPRTDALASIRRSLEAKKTNLVLIGMPGVGKSYQGRHLARLLDRPFVDIDRRFQEAYGPPGDYLRLHGEEAFRQKESAVVREVGKETGLVIASGGGVVTRPENYAPLAQNGRIYWLYRPLRYLSRRGRPLSAGGFPALRRLYGQRRPLYEAWADVRIDLGRDREASAREIWRDFLATYGD